MKTLDFIVKKYNLASGKSPVHINIDRFELPVLFNDLGFKIGAEIGVRRGDFSLTLCRVIPDLRLFCIDPWHVYKTSPRLPSQERQDANFEITKERLKPYNAQLIKKLSMEAVGDVGTESLDFVYIDGHHGYEFVRDDLREWGKRVRPGGIVSGDDYSQYAPGVVKAVDEYLAANRISDWFLTRPRRGTSSWFWIKS